MKINRKHIFEFPSAVRWIAGPGNVISRSEFFCPEPVKSAKIWIVADPHSYAKEFWQKLRNDGHDGGWLLGGSFLKYRLFINGDLIGAGPARPVCDGISAIHSFDVELRQGTNVIGVFSRGEKKGIALYLEATMFSGKKFNLYSNKDWNTLNMDQCYSPVCWERQNIEQFFKGCAGPGEWSEHIDGTKYPFGWNEAEFDARDWEPAEEYGSVTEQLDRRQTLNYEISKISPIKLIEIGRQHWLIDFGQEHIGGIELTGPTKEGCIELRLGEELMPNGQVRYQMRTDNCYQEIWRFPAGKKNLSHFGLRSFRYLELIGYADELKHDMVSIISVTTSFRQSESSFSCSDSALEKVWQLCKNSIASTVMDVYNDCFSRERTVYEADSYVNMLSHFAVESNTMTAKRTIEYLMTHNTWPCEWRQFMIPLFYEYVMQTGDLEFVHEFYQKLWDEYSFLNLINKGLIAEFPQEIIIDWPESCRDNYEFGNFCGVPNAFLYWNLVLLAEIAVFLGKTVDYAKLTMLAEQVKTAFNRKLFDYETGLYVDSENSKHSSFHVNMFALRFGLVPEDRIEKCLDFIINKGMVCSVYGAQFYLDALFMYNRASEAVALMTATNDTSWLGMINQGATVTFEAWHPNQKRNMSCSHPWAASPANVIVRHLFGLRPTAPGWRKYEFKPQSGGIDSAKIKLHTPPGILNASFRHDDTGLLIKKITVSNFETRFSEQTFRKTRTSRKSLSVPLVETEK